jgi:hypothetical protein
VDLPADLTPDERRLAAALDAMEKARVLAVTEGDLIRKAECDSWFQQWAPLIRALREKTEPWS